MITNPPENAPKTGERIISAIVVGILGISMLVLSIVMNKKKKKQKNNKKYGRKDGIDLGILVVHDRLESYVTEL